MALVTYARYVTVTGDTTTTQAAATASLAEAQDLLEEELSRVGLLEDTGEAHEERLILHANGQYGPLVYPAALPIISVADGSGYEIVGAGLSGATPDSSPDFGLVAGDRYATVTYRGGFTPATVPEHIARDIAWAAYQLARPANAVAVPVGVKSASVGDASVTYERARSATEAGIRWSRATLRHRRRRL